MKIFDVNVSWDDEAGVWIAISEEIPLALESNSYDALLEKAKFAAPEIIEFNHKIVEPVVLFFKSERAEKVAL